MGFLYLHVFCFWWTHLLMFGGHGWTRDIDAGPKTEARSFALGPARDNRPGTCRCSEYIWIFTHQNGNIMRMVYIYIWYMYIMELFNHCRIIWDIMIYIYIYIEIRHTYNATRWCSGGPFCRQSHFDVRGFWGWDNIYTVRFFGKWTWIYPPAIKHGSGQFPIYFFSFRACFPNKTFIYGGLFIAMFDSRRVQATFSMVWIATTWPRHTQLEWCWLELLVLLSVLWIDLSSFCMNPNAPTATTNE